MRSLDQYQVLVRRLERSGQAFDIGLAAVERVLGRVALAHEDLDAAAQVVDGSALRAHGPPPSRRQISSRRTSSCACNRAIAARSAGVTASARAARASASTSRSSSRMSAAPMDASGTSAGGRRSGTGLAVDAVVGLGAVGLGEPRSSAWGDGVGDGLAVATAGEGEGETRSSDPVVQAGTTSMARIAATKLRRTTPPSSPGLVAGPTWRSSGPCLAYPHRQAGASGPSAWIQRQREPQRVGRGGRLAVRSTNVRPTVVPALAASVPLWYTAITMLRPAPRGAKCALAAEHRGSGAGRALPCRIFLVLPYPTAVRPRSEGLCSSSEALTYRCPNSML